MKNLKKLFSIVAIIVALFLIAGLGKHSKSTVIKSGSEISMFIASDIHYYDKSMTDFSEGYEEYAVARDGKQLIYSEEIMDALEMDIRSKKPDIFIISGDLSFNGEKKNLTHLANRLSKIEKIGTKVYVIPGNHDILSIYANGYSDGAAHNVENVTHEEFVEIYDDFGYGESLTRDEKTLSYLAAPSEDIWLLMLDSNKYFNDFSMPTGDGFITQETIKWIRECGKMAEENDAKIIAVMHHPLLQHSLRNAQGSFLNNSKEIADLFKELNIKVNFSGHIHIQDIKSDNVDNPELYDIVNSALSVYPHQYGIVKYSAEEGFEYTKKRVDVEELALKSAQSLGSRPYERAIAELEDLGVYSKEEIDKMSFIVKDLNKRQFEGTVNSIKEELISSPVYKLF
ncbi:MAG: metallophosphoesterase, partial [Gudongella sp.]|nr:metallophosphoesterase [Gudongella sp.]